MQHVSKYIDSLKWYELWLEASLHFGNTTLLWNIPSSSIQSEGQNAEIVKFDAPGGIVIEWDTRCPTANIPALYFLRSLRYVKNNARTINNTLFHSGKWWKFAFLYIRHPYLKSKMDCCSGSLSQKSYVRPVHQLDKQHSQGKQSPIMTAS